MLNISDLRHEKEKIYLPICLIVGGLIWLALIRVACLFLILVAIVSWLASQYFKAFVYGNAVRVSKDQFGKIDQIAREEVPDFFVLSGQGALNALAIRFLTGKYILLFGELIDLCLKREAYAELKMIIGHELAHHALGHVNVWRNLLLLPARIVPFLGAAYSRACELSADRVGMALAGDDDSSKRALLALTVGSESLAADLDLQAFVAQEKYVPPVMGFIYELFASHPRMTVRIIKLKKYEEKRHLLRSTSSVKTLEEDARKAEIITQQVTAEDAREVAVTIEPTYCASCNTQILPGDRFCYNCGQKIIRSAECEGEKESEMSAL